ncbi:MAG: hypothetical protein KGJ23_05800 [Euryarchaeota archaeon]|nr:hypothetical protein [Euryarchaeota archaeon]MDE1836112.1 hypothetical protein [Euryarchaeota archaeon]MDE1879402.1 hypothetical protein [Euryarchaeota archaeon]MDE2044090.1 hypothetical protein [Thermoplasmata archaeon]
MPTSSERPTTISLPVSVRRRLLDYQIAGKTPAEVIEEFMDEIPPDYFRRDLQWALALPQESLEEFRQSRGLTAPKRSR